MLVHSANGSLATTIAARADRHSGGLLRWLVLGTAGMIALVLAISHAASVGAAAPTTYDTTICINYFTCYNTGTGAPVSNTNSGYPTYTIPNVSNGYPTYAAPNSYSGYPANTVVSTYFDPRYCNGIVSVVTDQYGNLIDVCAATGQRIIPFFPDYGYGAGFVGPSYVNGNFFYNGTNPNIFVNNGCPVGNFSCLGAFPFFGFPFGTGVFNGNTTVVAPGGNPIVVGPPFRVKEVTAPTATTAAPAAAPAAPAANYATALNTSSTPAAAPAVAIGGGDVHALSAPSPTKPAASDSGGSDDHRG
jgi:hypothetical protein